LRHQTTELYPVTLPLVEAAVALGGAGVQTTNIKLDLLELTRRKKYLVIGI
jgi:hypothetical protein